MESLLKAAYQPYKWFFVLPFMVLSTVFHSLLCMLIGLFLGKGSGNIAAVSWSKLACLVGPVRVRFYGRENYDRKSAYVVVANHQSMVDIPVLHGWLGLKIKWVMKKELKRIPVFGHGCESLGCIYVDRFDREAAIQAMKDADSYLDDTASVIFFPEGTRSRDGKLLPFKKGAFRYALHSGLPILPVTIKNTGKILPCDSLDLFPGVAEVVIHPPVDIKTYTIQDMDRLIQDVRQIIGSAL
ncbi:MAG: lysophospholipid acyltransferase family protein [Pseudomonadota bacterium]